MFNHTDDVVEAIADITGKREDTYLSFNEDATDEVEISHTRDTAPDRELVRSLYTRMACENRQRERESSGTTRNEDARFDKAICCVTDFVFEQVGLIDPVIAPHKQKALLLQVVRGLNNTELADHISRYSVQELEEFGLRTDYHLSSYRKAKNELKANDQYTLLESAGTQAVDAVFRVGIPVPESVLDRYGLSYDVGPEAADFPAPEERVALYTLIQKLLDIIAPRFDPDRAENELSAPRRMIGSFAHAAFTDKSQEYYEQTAQHLVDLEDSLTGSGFQKQLNQLAVWEVKNMFDDIYKALLEYVLDSGVVSEPVTIAYDLTKLDMPDETEGTNPYVTEDGQLRFASLAFVDSSLEFAFDLRLLKSKGNRTDVMQNLLEELDDMVDIRLFLGDRGLDGADDISACRAVIPNSWMIHQPEKESSGRNDHDRLRAGMEPGGTNTIRGAGYDDLSPPVNMFGYSGATEKDDTIEPIRAFYTGIDPPTDPDDRDKLVTTLNFAYNQRGRIETAFRTAKNVFDVATDSDDPVQKSFYFHMSILYYNMYQIANTVPSPERGLELDITPKELVTVTQALALGGTQPKALKAVIEDT